MHDIQHIPETGIEQVAINIAPINSHLVHLAVKNCLSQFQMSFTGSE